MMFSLFNSASAAMINPSLPGPYDVSKVGPVGILGNAYQFSLILGGVLAFIMIVWGGIEWMISQGNPGKISDAKDRIVQALLGLLLLLGAYLVLNVINPTLIHLDISKLSPLREGGGGVQPTATSSCYSADCVVIDLPWEFKNGNQADPLMVSELHCIAGAGFNLRVTEAMPPSSQHSDHRHMNGCAIDATLGPAGAMPQGGCAALQALQSVISSCGGTYDNEYFTSCGGVNTEHSTGDHIHINGPVGCN